MKVGITGHQQLPDAALRLVQEQATELATATHVDVICSLAAGADQVTARAFLELGGSLEVVLPCLRYEEAFESVDQRQGFERLRARSASVTQLPYPEPSSEAFLAAGLVVVERCELLVAVWDGEPARGIGGTADVVEYARAIGRAVKVWWPEGVDR